MKVIHLAEVPEREATVNSALFTGPVTSQRVLTDRESEFNIAYIHFPDGVRNKFHTHTQDQVLIVTDGRGMVTTEDREEALAVGDIAFIPAGEKHRHGAVPGSRMTHVSILPAGSKTEQLED
ncbi:MAG: cupin domain-containing protein [Dehalococcoidia bacterium]